MNSRRFKYEGQEWEAEYAGTGTSAGSGHIPSKPTRFTYKFRRISDGKISVRISHGKISELRGHLSGPDPNALSEEELTGELRSAIMKAMRRPRRRR